jgi:1-acyl-sn-glycerol-3-phosphate acyltransferase
MTLYTVLVRILRVINHLYFVEVRSTGLARVPDTGPVLLAANHPSSILDSVLMSTALPRPIRYLARSGLFRIPLVAWFFR